MGSSTTMLQEIIATKLGGGTYNTWNELALL